MAENYRKMMKERREMFKKKRDERNAARAAGHSNQTGFPAGNARRRRILGGRAGVTDQPVTTYYEDQTNTNRPPEDFFSFVRYSKNTRTRLITSNQDLFIMFGQNGLFAMLIIATYLSVWLGGLGRSKNKAVQIYITVQRLLFKIFFIKFQFIVYIELGMHDMTIAQPFKYRLSYIISAVYSTILLIELARAYNLLKKRYTKEEVEHFIGHE
jgi:hypothetical protein